MIELNPTDLVTKVHYRHELSGYEANYIQPFYDFLPEDKKKEVIESKKAKYLRRGTWLIFSYLFINRQSTVGHT